MSDNIPFEIQTEIIKKVPDIKSLIRFRAVSKPWKSLIDTLTRQQDLAPNVSALMKQLNDTIVIGYSRGLLCLYAFDKGGMLVLWNPSIIGILDAGYFGVFGFTVCPVTNEPTTVNISFP